MCRIMSSGVKRNTFDGFSSLTGVAFIIAPQLFLYLNDLFFRQPIINQDNTHWRTKRVQFRFDYEPFQI